MSKWLSIFLEGDDLEEKCSLLFEFGVLGSTMTPDGRACCYCKNENGSINAELSDEILKLGLVVCKLEQIEETNWTQNCEALFETVQVGVIKITPVKSFEDGSKLVANPKSDLIIIPGTGFGTGHHPTTFNLLKLLQHQELKSSPPKTVLDAGTGSGILAIGACRLFDCNVDGYEIDSLAVENAKENVALNKLEDRITLYCESVDRSEKKYDLVIANLYAELLELLCSHLVERGKQSCHFLLSGIRADLTAGVIKKYEAHGLQCIEKIISEGWTALMLKRAS